MHDESNVWSTTYPVGLASWQVRHTHEHNEMDLEEKSVLLRRRFHAFRKNVVSIDYTYLV